MNKIIGEKPNYGNWVSKRMVYAPAGIGLLFLGFSFVNPLMIILSILFLAIAGYFAYARQLFSQASGNVQRKIQELVLANLEWDGRGKALDIGCGNGALSILLALKYTAARITGIDSWGKGWEYSKNTCEKNGEIEGVAARMVFQEASASQLPFEDGVFDAAVSNLAFHEVRDAKDKRDLIREGLRVVRKGGKFSFQDLFLGKMMYGEINDLVAEIKSWGITRVEFIRTCDSDFIPAVLKLPFMVGTMGLLLGEK